MKIWGRRKARREAEAAREAALAAERDEASRLNRDGFERLGRSANR